MDNSNNTAWESGYTCAKNGGKLESCPYDKSTELSIWWRDGFMQFVYDSSNEEE